MNKDRRKQIGKAIDDLNEVLAKLEDIKEDIDSIRCDEQDYLDNMPENLQSSEKYEVAENAISELETAYDALENIGIIDVIENLENAQE